MKIAQGCATEKALQKAERRIQSHTQRFPEVMEERGKSSDDGGHQFIAEGNRHLHEYNVLIIQMLVERQRRPLHQVQFSYQVDVQSSRNDDCS